MKVIMLMMVVVLMLCFLSSTSAQMPDNIPPCVSKLANCSTKSMESTNLATSDMPCCSEWAEEIKDNTQCVCDNFKPYLSSLSDFFNLCKIDAPTCQGTSNSAKGSTAHALESQKNGANKKAYSAGFPILLLIMTIIVKY